MIEDKLAIVRQMRSTYEAPTLEAAQASLDDFAEQWHPIYPAMIRSWENAWGEFVPFLDFPPELRRVVYTTNAFGSLSAQFRRGVRHRGHFSNEQAAMKGPLPHRHQEATEASRPHRPDPRLEDHLEHPDHPLRRPHRSHRLLTMLTPAYTNVLTDPGR